MRVISRAKLREFVAKHREADVGLNAWYHVMKRATFKNPNDLLGMFPKASLLGDGVTVFNIGSHRLVVHMRYDLRTVYVRAVMTHPEYDRWNKQR